MAFIYINERIKIIFTAVKVAFNSSRFVLLGERIKLSTKHTRYFTFLIMININGASAI